jgi:hypothetical protein
MQNMAKQHTLASHALAVPTLLFIGALMAARPPLPDLTQDGVKGQMASGSVSGKVITFKLTAASTAQRLTCFESKSSSQKTLLRGGDGIAALTFCDVPIQSSKSSR